MAISDSPETIGVTTATDHGESVRRRPISAPAGNGKASTSSSSMAEELEDFKNVSNGGDVDRIVDNNERIYSENVSGEGEGEERVVNGGGAQNSENAIRYSYRPSSPAHLKVKESPLSSDAIFRQVCFFNCLV